MSLAGGSWLWSCFLRSFLMLPMLFALTLLPGTSGPGGPGMVFAGIVLLESSEAREVFSGRALVGAAL